MRKSLHSLLLFLCLLAIPFYFLACKKDGGKVNITLHDKPLATIQSSIAGKWDLKYVQGGVVYGTYPQIGFSWTFTSGNRVIQSIQDSIIVDTTINWVRDKGVFLGPNDSTYIMTFSDKEGVPLDYVVDGIFNDTLVIHDDAYDAFYYHFTKIN